MLAFHRCGGLWHGQLNTAPTLPTAYCIELTIRDAGLINETASDGGF